MQNKDFKMKRRNKSSLNEDTQNYYKRIHGILQDGSVENEAKGALIDNMFSQLIEEAMEVCQCPQTSHTIEYILPQASCTNLKSLAALFSQNWANACKNQCSSHIVQKLLTVMPKFIAGKLMDLNFAEPDPDSDEVNLALLLVNLTVYFLDNVEECITDLHMSHVFRALLQVLGGTCAGGDTLMKSKRNRNFGNKFTDQQGDAPKDTGFVDYEVPATFRSYLKSFYKRIFQLKDFGLYLTERNANPVIQTLLHVLHKVDDKLCQKAIHKVIKQSRIKDTLDNINLPPVVADTIGSFLIQLVITLCSEDLFLELHTKLFKARIHKFATHPCANFVLQKIIKACKSKDIFCEIIDELAQCVPEVLEARCYGVLVAASETAETLSCKEDQLIQSLMEAFHCWLPDSRQVMFVQLLSMCKPYEMAFGCLPEDSDRPPRLDNINYHGSLLLQHLLRFTNTKLLENSFLHLESQELSTLACHPCGSHVIEALFQSKTIKVKAKQAVLDKLNGTLTHLACDRNASRMMESLWKCLETKQKSQVAAELAQQMQRIRSDKFGRHIFHKFALHQFANRKSEWASAQNSDMKKRQMFQDVLGAKEDTGASPSKKFKKMKKKKNRN